MTPIRNLFFVVAVVGWAAGLSYGFGTQGTIPETFYSSTADRTAPIWISADLARTHDYRLDWRLFAQEERASLRRKLAARERLKAEEGTRSLTLPQSLGREPVQDDNCVTYEKTFHHLGEELESSGLRGLLTSARGIYSATKRRRREL